MFRDRRDMSGGRGLGTIKRDRRGRSRYRFSALERLEEKLVLAPAPTTLAVSAVVGTYGGTATVTANLSSAGNPVAGESVDLHIGATDLGPVVTDVNGDATIPAASLASINAGTYTNDVTASFAGDTNFDPSNGANNLSVTAAPLTITADDQTKVYGAALPTLTASYTGFVNGDTSASLTTPPAVTTVATAASHVAGSPYAITAAGAVDPNYTISYVAGSLTVTTAPLTITADDQTKVYGAALPTLTASYTTFVNGDTAASLTTPPTLSTTATAASHVSGSPYAITAAGAVDPDYMISYAPGALTVTPAPLTITADDQTKVYGAALPTLTASYTTFVNGDTAASLTTPPTLSTTATTFSDVSGSPYAITAAGAVDPDYTISYVGGGLTVTPAPLTVVVNNLSKVYGQVNPTLTGVVTGILNGDDVTVNYATTAVQFSDVVNGGYPITVSGLSGAKAGDYSTTVAGGSVTPGDLTITPAPLTVQVADQSKVYGQVNPTLVGNVIGVLNGDDVTVNYATSATQFSDVLAGGYAINPTGLSGTKSEDYSLTVAGSSVAPGTLTITPAPLAIAVDSLSKVYGQANPTLTGTVAGVLNGDDVTANYSTTATTSSSVVTGGYPITFTGLSGTKVGNYMVTASAPGTLTVTSAPLTITPVNVIKTYGFAVPTLTATYSGFVNGDTSTSLTTPVSLSTSVTAATHFGVYPITASGATSSNYTISFVDGAIAVTPAILTVVPVNAIISYGLQVPTLTANYFGFMNGDTAANLSSQVSLSTTAAAGNPVGVYPLTAGGGASADYTINYVQGAIAIIANPGGVAFLNSLYQSILGRDTETFGFVYWLTALADGASDADVANQIYFSAEGKAARDGNKVPFISENTAYRNALKAQAAALGLPT